MAKTVKMRRVGGSNLRRLVSEKTARALEGTGRFERVGAVPAPRRESLPEPPVVQPEPEAPEVPAEPVEASTETPADDYEAMTYWELRRFVNERGLEAEDNTKEALLRALRYQTRAMQAEE